MRWREREIEHIDNSRITSLPGSDKTEPRMKCTIVEENRHFFPKLAVFDLKVGVRARVKSGKYAQYFFLRDSIGELDKRIKQK